MPSPTPVLSVFSPNPPAWRWYEGDTRGRAQWRFFTEEPQTALERGIQRPHLARILNAFRCVRDAETQHSAAIAAHSRFSTFWIALALKLRRSNIPVVACSFHFELLPQGVRRRMMSWVYGRVQRFIVHSEVERLRYATHFRLPLDRFDLVRWGVQPELIESEHGPPLIPGEYVCAIGKDGRDYRTLIEAMKAVPEIPMVIVAQPHNLTGVEVPRHVRVLYNIPNHEALNILKHAQFMALPLLTGETSCGHITIVSALLARKAVIVTNSIGIADYFPPQDAAPKVQAADASGWAEAIRLFWRDRNFRERCAQRGQEFALDACTHQVALENTLNVFRKVGVSLDAGAVREGRQRVS